MTDTPPDRTAEDVEAELVEAGDFASLVSSKLDALVTHAWEIVKANHLVTEADDVEVRAAAVIELRAALVADGPRDAVDLERRLEMAMTSDHFLRAVGHGLADAAIGRLPDTTLNAAVPSAAEAAALSYALGLDLLELLSDDDPDISEVIWVAASMGAASEALRSAEGGVSAGFHAYARDREARQRGAAIGNATKQAAVHARRAIIRQEAPGFLAKDTYPHGHKGWTAPALAQALRDSWPDEGQEPRVSIIEADIKALGGVVALASADQ